ncbi:MAG: hypothetical protein ACO3QO_03075 [Candidatus Kapaibacteriota bacterium]|jgi:hypothetical protein
MDASTDLYVYSPEHLLEQAAQADEILGYRRLSFYVDDRGQLAKEATSRRAEFFYSPSGGTLRDADLNIVLYSAKFDLYKGLGRAT